MKAMNEQIAAMIEKFMINMTGKSKNSYSRGQSKSQIFHQNRVRTLKMKCLLSPLNIYLMNITLRENTKIIFIHIIKALNNQKKNWYISRENKKWNQKRSHQKMLKIKCLLPIMKLYILKNDLRQNYRLILINLITFLTNQNNNLWIS